MFMNVKLQTEAGVWRRKRNRSLRACLVSGKEERVGRKGGIPRRGQPGWLVERSVKDERLEEGQGRGGGLPPEKGVGVSWWVGRG